MPMHLIEKLHFLTQQTDTMNAAAAALHVHVNGLYLGRLLHVLLLLLSCCLCTAATAAGTGTGTGTASSRTGSGKFLWFSDVHLDVYYGRPEAAWHFADSPCGGTATGGLPAPTIIDDADGNGSGNNLPKLEFPYSHFGCGSTAELVRSALEAAREVFADPSATTVVTGTAAGTAAGAGTGSTDEDALPAPAPALPDFILFSGDSTRHFSDVTPDANATVAESIRFVYDETREAFTTSTAFASAASADTSEQQPQQQPQPQYDVPIVQLPPLDLGNNDMPNGDYVLDVTSYEPCLVVVDEENGGTSSIQLPVATNAWLQQASELVPWTFANDIERSTFACGGYVEREIASPSSPSSPSPLLRILVLNTVIYSKKLVSDPPIADPKVDDPFGQLAWMRSRLDAARRDGVPVYLTGHIPPIQESFVYSIGHRFWHQPFVLRYYALAKEYDDVVAAHLYGHTHVNELRHIPLLDGAAAPLLVQSAISPGLGNLPTFTVASYDHQSDANPMRITDLAKWTVEYNPKTETWPADDDSGAGGLVWKAQVPSILNYFGMGGLTNGDVLDLGRRMSTTPSLFVKYWNYFTKGHPYVVGPCLKEPCPREEICVVMCGVTEEIWSACVGEGGESIPLSDYTCADAKDDGGVDGDPFPTTASSEDSTSSSARKSGTFGHFPCYLLMFVLYFLS